MGIYRSTPLTDKNTDFDEDDQINLNVYEDPKYSNPIFNPTLWTSL